MSSHRSTHPSVAPRVGRRVPAFVPLPLRARVDGWTPRLQAAFLGILAETGSVLAAAAEVGKSRESAYRLRRKPGAESFAEARDMAAGTIAGPRPRKFTAGELWRRARYGLLEPMLKDGRFVGVARIRDDFALAALVVHLDAAVEQERRGKSGDS